MFGFLKRSSIRKAVMTVGPELSKRYGRPNGCTLPQLRKVAEYYGYEGTTMHYLCYCFLSDDDYRKAKRWSFFVGWKRIEKESEEIMAECKTFRWSSSFHESHTGFPVD